MHDEEALPEEFGFLRSAKYFAECQIFCRVLFRTLGKEALYRVPNKKLSLKENTRQTSSLPSIFL
jgi:hypothetical protein